MGFKLSFPNDIESVEGPEATAILRFVLCVWWLSESWKAETMVSHGIEHSMQQYCREMNIHILWMPRCWEQGDNLILVPFFVQFEGQEEKFANATTLALKFPTSYNRRSSSSWPGTLWMPGQLSFFLLLIMIIMETRTVSFQHSSTTNLSLAQFKDEIEAADHWGAKELPSRWHRWQSPCGCNEPFTLGGFYALSFFDNDLRSKQNLWSRRLIETWDTTN